MENILNAIYRGEIHPEETYRPELSELLAARKDFLAHQEQLLAELEEPMRRKVLALLEKRNFVSSYEMEDAYVQGMKLGAQLAVSLLDEEKKA